MAVLFPTTKITSCGFFGRLLLLSFGRSGFCRSLSGTTISGGFGFTGRFCLSSFCADAVIENPTTTNVINNISLKILITLKLPLSFQLRGHFRGKMPLLYLQARCQTRFRRIYRRFRRNSFTKLYVFRNFYTKS